MRCLVILGSVLCVVAAAQQRAAAPPADAATLTKLLEAGRCSEGLPGITQAYARAADAALRKRLATAGVRCAMTLNRAADASALVGMLVRDFPKNADVLYLAVHTYSDLSVRASQELLYSHPESYQVHQLNAEALETQGKWDEAAGEYRAILASNPSLEGIHYRLGRILLSRPETPSSKEEAKREFQEELSVNPANAGAEFVLGELARQDGNNDEAIERFTRATKLDAAFTEAWIGLGQSLLGAGKSGDAVLPLEKAVKLQPAHPVAHFQLATAYRRVGRTADANREMQLHNAITAKTRQQAEDVSKAVSGSNTQRP